MTAATVEPPTIPTAAGSAPPRPVSALPPEPAAGALSEFARRGFRVMNRWFMAPALRAGLGPWLATPVGGWILLLRVRGRRSGLVREVPLSYLVTDGAAWVMAGFGDRTDWYRNLLADPRVEIILPGRTLSCSAEIVDDVHIRRRIIPALARATGLPGYLSGVDPFRSTDDALLAATAWVPLVRLQPEGGRVIAGPDDPGGLGWVWRQAVVLVLGALLIGRMRRLLR
jgi:deazaflavin-dependent oxidoreductase (nitroreductase family)